jgi:hypothetical protein
VDYSIVCIVDVNPLLGALGQPTSTITSLVAQRSWSGNSPIMSDGATSVLDAGA